MLKITLTPRGRELYQLLNDLLESEKKPKSITLNQKILDTLNDNYDSFSVNDLDILNEMILALTLTNLDSRILSKVYEVEAHILSAKPQLLGSYINKSQIHLTQQTLEKLLKICGGYVHSLKLFKVLNDCQNVSDDFLETIGKYCPHLQDIDLYDTRITDEGFSFFTEQCFSLRSVGLCNSQISDSSIKALGLNCPNLLSIDLSFAHFTEFGFLDFANTVSSKLEEINLSGTAIRDFEMVILTQRCPKLESAYLNFTSIGDQTLESFSKHCSQLKHLFISNTKVTDEGLEQLAAGCHQLQSIYLSSNKISDAGIECLAKGCPMLHTVYVDSTQITDKSLKALSEHCHMLQTIDLSNTVISYNGLKMFIEALSILQTVSLDCTPITKEQRDFLQKERPLILFSEG